MITWNSENDRLANAEQRAADATRARRRARAAHRTTLTLLCLCGAAVLVEGGFAFVLQRLGEAFALQWVLTAVNAALFLVLVRWTLPQARAQRAAAEDEELNRRIDLDRVLSEISRDEP